MTNLWMYCTQPWSWHNSQLDRSSNFSRFLRIHVIDESVPGKTLCGIKETPNGEWGDEVTGEDNFNCKRCLVSYRRKYKSK